MYVDSSTAAARRSAGVSAAARRTRLADAAIVSQWLLEQVPSDHRHARDGAASAGTETSRPGESPVSHRVASVGLPQ
jgi:hypothetical protein